MGATNILACERIDITEMAERIVAQNGFGGQIRAISKDSNCLEVRKDTDGQADILISEIISSDLLAENVLDMFEDA